MEKKPLREFFEQYIEGTAEKALVPDAVLSLAHLTNAIANAIGLREKNFAVYVSTRTLKHLYDKKPAEEFGAILDGLDEVVRFPTHIYCNKTSKRGNYCLVGSFNGSMYICPIEIFEFTPALFGIAQFGATRLGDAVGGTEIYITTAFRLRNEKYLAKYALLWSREDGDPHRNALDAPEGVY